MTRLIKILDALSQLVNVTLCPHINDTSANESLSGRAYRKDWWIMHPINWFFFWQDNHCQRAYLKDADRAMDYLRKVNAR